MTGADIAPSPRKHRAATVCSLQYTVTSPLRPGWRRAYLTVPIRSGGQ